MPSSAYPKRLIEVDLPIRRLSDHGSREKSLRKGHISTLHIWWARKPQGVCRSVLAALLWPDPGDATCPPEFRQHASDLIRDFAQHVVSDKTLASSCSPESWRRWVTMAEYGTAHSHADIDTDLRDALLDLLADFANPDNAARLPYLGVVQALTRAAHVTLDGDGSERPLVVDTFAGGGSLPLEALRIGADAIGLDVNPVATLLNKTLLEYVPRHGQRLADSVRYWGKWIRDRAIESLSDLYPASVSGQTPIGYLWARTIISAAPGDDSPHPVEVPLIPSMWLVRRPFRSLALRWARDAGGAIIVDIVDMTFADGDTRRVRRPRLEIFTPERPSDVPTGSVAKGSATCPITGFVTPIVNVRQQLRRRGGGGSDARLLVVMESGPTSGRTFRVPCDEDVEGLEAADQRLAALRTDPEGATLIPDEPISTNELRRISIPLYGMTSWGHLCTARQMVAMTTMLRLVQETGRQVATDEPDLGAAVQTCLALALDRLANSQTTLGRWHRTRELITGAFGRQALGMTWDYAEANLLSDAYANWLGAIDWVAAVCETTAQGITNTGTALLATATNVPLPDAAVDVVAIDPPYYDAVPYGHLSEFFYVWLKRSVGNIHPDLFTAAIVDKSDEIVVDRPHRLSTSVKDRQYFETNLGVAFAEIRRLLKPSGVATVIFASKSTESWEATVQALVESGLTVTASWPIDTEMISRLNAAGTASLSSSVHLVCRPRLRETSAGSESVGDWRHVIEELPLRIKAWLPRLTSEGVVGADAIFACIGPALEIFSRYDHVERASGERVKLAEYFEHVWAAVAREALTMVFQGADATGFEPDARLTAMWLWTTAAPQRTAKGPSEANATASETDDDESGQSTDDGNGVGERLQAFALQYDAARKIAQGLGAHLDRLEHVVAMKGDLARLLSVAERAGYLFGKDGTPSPATAPRRRATPRQLDMFAELGQAEEETAFGIHGVPAPGRTTLDKVHQAMILFGAGRADGLRRFVVELGVGQEPAFWSLAQSLSALYPAGTEEKRWVDGVLARKRGLGF